MSAGAERLRPGQLAAYGAPAAAYSFYLFFVQFYFLKFATDVLLLAPALIGALFGLGRIWDAISDPLVGTWSDRTRGRFGRRKPWMLASIPALALASLAVWGPPDALSGNALVAWSAVSLFAFYLAFTAYTIPHLSLGAELSLDHHERSRVFGSQRAAFVFGMLLAFVAIGYAQNADDPRRAPLVVVGVAAVLASLLLLASPWRLRERPEFQRRRAAPAFRALRDVVRNPHARVLLLAWFFDGFGGGVLGVLAPYNLEYVWGRPDLITVVPAFFVGGGVAAIPMWVALSRRFGKRDVWRASVVGTAACFGSTFFVGPGEMVLLCALVAGAGVCTGCSGVIGTSMLADTVDHDELASGERKEGAYSAAWGFALKLGIGIVVMGTGFALQASGFTPNVAQDHAALLTLRGLFAGGPVLGALATVLLLSRYRLDAAAHHEIRAALDARAEKS